MRIQWREKSKKVLLSNVSARHVSVQTGAKEKVSFNAVYLASARDGVDPMFLATTLSTETVQDLTRIVRLYSWRWGIETFFWTFKQALRCDSWRMFSSWGRSTGCSQRHIWPYLVPVMMTEFTKRGRTAEMRALMGRLEETLRSRFARPVEEMTLGRFLRLIALDFPSPHLAGAAL